MWMRKLVKHVVSLLAAVLMGGALSATLVRFAPGFGVDEQELDSRLSESSLQALRTSRDSEKQLVPFYLGYLGGLLQGELGVSRSLRRPVRELLVDRLPVTLGSMRDGLLLAWFLSLGLVLPKIWLRSVIYDVLTTVLSSFFACVPAAALAVFLLFSGGPSSLAVGLVVFPKIFGYTQNLLAAAAVEPHIITAKAKGVGRLLVGLRHVLIPVVPQILPLAGMSVSLALGAAIPVEVICDSPGIGQLAWQAALGRDLPLLVNLTTIVTLITLLANLCGDLAAATFQGGPA